MTKQNPGSFQGSLLRIDLGQKNSSAEEIPASVLHDYVGGRGLGAHILYQEISEKIDALSEQNKIIFSAGAMTGTKFPTSARSVAVTISPLTSGYLYSMAGGKFGLNIKKAGYDSVVIEGKAEQPVCIIINNDKVNFIDASHLWGMKSTRALYHLKEKLGNEYSITMNGPGGENLVQYAGLMTDDSRQFGRGGAGAVLGYKNVKAIAVRGDHPINVHDPQALDENLKDIYALLKKQPGVSQNFPRYGSGENLEARSAVGNLPTKNWMQSTYEKAWEISTTSMMDEKNMSTKEQGCYGCPLQCSNLMKAVSKEFAGYYCDGPEYETLYALGSSCLIGDPNFVVAANDVCDELGIDTMSAGLVISFVMECVEKGLLDESKLNGKPISFGHTEHILELLEDIAYRRGIGDLLAKGVQKISEEIGQDSSRFAMHVKGMEIGGYDPRTAKGQSVVLAAGNRGGCHHGIGLTAVAEVNQGIGQQIEGKGKMVKKFSRVRILSDSLANCTFAFSRTFDYGIWSRIMTSVTGLDFDENHLMKMADRINTIERLINFRQGFTRADDRLPKRLQEDPLPDGPTKGSVVTPKELDTMLNEYYAEMGWNEEGYPTEEALQNYGLK